MAHGEPPRSHVNSFRLLFMIVRDGPPELEGAFSSDFKDFVWQCLRKVGSLHGKGARAPVVCAGSAWPAAAVARAASTTAAAAAAQDPADRPTAIDLLMHPFVSAAEQPPDLRRRIAEYVASRPPPRSRPAGGTLGGTAAAQGIALRCGAWSPWAACQRVRTLYPKFWHSLFGRVVGGQGRARQGRGFEAN
jgi:serine/threonine-protein kinase 24/25/MST4